MSSLTTDCLFFFLILCVLRQRAGPDAENHVGFCLAVLRDKVQVRCHEMLFSEQIALKSVCSTEIFKTESNVSERRKLFD